MPTRLYPKMPRHGQAELYLLFGFKFAVTIIYIQFTFTTVASGCLCFVMSLCIPYVCIVSLCVFSCKSACALFYTEDMFIDELHIDKVTV